MPLTASANAIWNQAYHWSQGQNKWVPVTLVGTLYPGAQLNAAGQGYLTNIAATSLTVPKTDALGGSIYVVTWDYTYQNSTWAGPKSSTCTNAQGCWRVEAVPVM